MTSSVTNSWLNLHFNGDAAFPHENSTRYWNVDTIAS